MSEMEIREKFKSYRRWKDFTARNHHPGITVEEQGRLDEAGKRLMDWIDLLEDTRLRDVLKLRYVDAARWDKVAETMHYSLKSVHRLHDKAIAELQAKRLS